MAKKEDIDTDITLEIDGDLLTPNQLAGAITAFAALLNNAHKELGAEKPVQWGVQVKEGSSLIGYVPRTLPNPQAIEIIVNGIKQFESGWNRPAGFSEAMLFNLQTLCESTRTGKKYNTAIKVWVHKEPVNLSSNIKENINKALQGAFVEYGAIEGLLQTLDSHKGYQFVIYEPLYNKKIICNIGNDDVPGQAYHLWEKRVEAEGLIKYSVEGLPYEIKVDRLSALIPVSGIPDYKLTKGILKHYV